MIIIMNLPNLKIAHSQLCSLSRRDKPRHYVLNLYSITECPLSFQQVVQSFLNSMAPDCRRTLLIGRVRGTQKKRVRQIAHQTLAAMDTCTIQMI